MCMNPVRLDTGVEVACRVCRSCRGNQVQDWTGRVVAEMQTAATTLFATLTYGQDDRFGGAENNLRAKMLHYSDVRQWLALIRKWTNRDEEGREFAPDKPQEARLRYFIVGEKGNSGTQRCHWHVILFCMGRTPPGVILSPPGKPYRYMHKHQKGGLIWPHGWTHWRQADPEGARYIMKYVLKTDVREGEKRIGFSLLPPLGNDYFVSYARRFVEAGLSPQERWYTFPGDLDRYGQSNRYYLIGASLYNFCAAFADAWASVHGNENWPFSELMARFEEERYKRSIAGEWSWRDSPEWLALIKQEEREQWVKAEKARVLNQLRLSDAQ